MEFNFMKASHTFPHLKVLSLCVASYFHFHFYDVSNTIEVIPVHVRQWNKGRCESKM